MNRFEFMQALERALYDVSAEEKEAALQYYNDYLDDAARKMSRVYWKSGNRRLSWQKVSAAA